MTHAARTYAKAKAVLIVYGMGVTQHLMGVENIHMIANLALLRGNIGKPGANICSVRGHSNVQGQRTVGITEKPGLVPFDKLSQLYKLSLRVGPADRRSTPAKRSSTASVAPSLASAETF
jgi:anaerobic selenocysteine-containing dehydrogenase